MIELTAGPARAVVDLEAGGRLAELDVDGLSLLVARTDDPLAWGSYPMAPWAGRVGAGRFSFRGRDVQLPLDLPPHAIHGTVYRRPWRDLGGGRLETDLGPDWPWPGSAHQQIELREDGIELRLEVRAEREPFPATLGWHPWFARSLQRGGPAELALAPGRMLERDAVAIPTGAVIEPTPPPWDDCFVELASPTRIRWPDALELTLESSADHWMVYTEPAHALCVEPMTGPPNALVTGAAIVRPEQPLAASFALRWHSDADQTETGA
jgi:aldose 1-epimerase